MKHITNNHITVAMAYDLCVSDVTYKNMLRKDILKIKKDNFIKTTDKNYTDVRNRAFLRDNTFLDIMSVFEECEKTPSVLECVCSRIFTHLAKELRDTLESRDSENSFDRVEMRSEMNYIAADWGLFAYYIIQHYDEEAAVNISKTAFKDNRRALAVSGLIYNNTGKWLSSYTIIKDNDELFESYDFDKNAQNNESYKKLFRPIYDTLINAKKWVFKSSMTTPFALGDCSMSSAAEDYNYSFNRIAGAESRGISSVTGDKSVPISTEEYIETQVISRLQRYVADYSIAGIDLMSLYKRANISGKEYKDIINKSFILGTLINKTESSVKEIDIGLIDLVVSQVVCTIISKTGKNILKEAKEKNTESEEIKAARKLLKEAKGENELLTARLNKLKEEKPKENKSEIKALRSELAELRKTLKSKEKRIDELTEEVEEVKSIIEEEDYEEDLINFTPEFEEYIKDHKVLVWGFRDDDAAKYKEMYPELTCVSSDDRLTRQQLDKYDVVLMGTGYTNHVSFWLTRDLLKNAKKDFAYMRKNDRNISHLINAWAVATKRAKVENGILKLT